MSTQIIINADDFGATSAVNSAVVQARKNGVLTSASLMVTGESVQEAVAIARDDAGLAVGLHLTLTNGRSVLPKEDIPTLVKDDAAFRESPVLAGLRYYFDSQCQMHLRLEIEAQFKAFLDTGLTLSHVDGHQHMHAHPAVFPIVVEYASRYGARGIRVPVDPFVANLRADRSGIVSKVGVTLCHAYLAKGCRRLLSNTGLSWCDVSIGSMMSGRMDALYIIEMLQSLDCGSMEVYLHPSTTRTTALGPNPGDLNALLNSRLIEFLKSGDYVLTNYHGISEQEGAGR